MTTYWQNWSLEAQRLMQRRNDEWRARFGLTEEPYRWDLDCALLTFQRDHDALIADLTLVGTLSHTEGSFLWSWANSDIPEKAVRRIERVREFGTDNDLPLLVDATTRADHAQALELAVVAGRVLDAQGLFIDRCGDVTLYFLLFDFRLTANTVDGERVECAVDGPNLPAIACHHLREAGSFATVYIGWVQAEFDPANREPGDLMAWCSQCDQAYEAEGGWTEASEPLADFRVVCEQCFWRLHAAQERLRPGRN